MQPPPLARVVDTTPAQPGLNGVSLRGFAPARRSHDVVLAERQRWLAMGASSVVAAFFSTSDVDSELFGIEAIRAPAGSAADHSFHDRAQYASSDYAWMAGATWTAYTVAGETYSCIGGRSAAAMPNALCEFRDGDIQGTGRGIGFSVQRLLALTIDSRLQIEAR